MSKFYHADNDVVIQGNPKIGEATAEKMKEYRSVIWAQHGIFSTGETLDEVFGLIETIEKTKECTKWRNEL